MKGFAKIILAVVAGIVVLLALILTGVNLYLQSGNVQNRIRLATEQALGTPVTVKRTFYTPWSGLTLSGLSLPDPTIAGQTLVDAPEFSVQFEFFPLLARHLVISEISLNGPHLALRQTEDRKWVLLAPKHAKPPGEKPAASISPTPPHVRLPEYTVELKQFHIRDGFADIIDRKGQSLARVSGLSVDGKIESQEVISGDLWIDSIEIAQQLYPNRLRAHFVQEGDHLAVTDVKCAIAGGKVRAEFHIVAPRHGEPDFRLKSEVEEVSIPTLISEARGNEIGTAGTLLGHFELGGNPLDVSTLTGQGEFSLDSAQLRPLDFIQQIGALLHIDELQMLALQQAQLRFGIAKERFSITDLTLKTDNLVITGKGPINFDGKMKLSGRFMVNEKIQRQLGGLLGDNFTPSEDANYKQVAFSVTGHVDHPKTDLIEKVTGIELHNMGGLLKGLFRMPTPPSAPSPEPSSTGEPTKPPASS